MTTAGVDTIPSNSTKGQLMPLQILLLKRDRNQTPRPETDLHPPPEDLLGRFHVTGRFDAVVLGVVPDGLDFARRNRLPLDGQFFLVKECLTIPDPSEVVDGVVRW